MSGRQLSGEPEEQVDLEGDVDGMDDDDGGYRRCGSHDDLEEEDNDARRAHDGDRMAAEPAAGVAAGDDDDDMYKEEGSGDGPEDEEENGKHGSEIFIGGLPCDVTEADIRELCEPLGEICEVSRYFEDQFCVAYLPVARTCDKHLSFMNSMAGEVDKGQENKGAFWICSFC
jgi:heterogeneous nuclear ribonucleoprotein R